MPDGGDRRLSASRQRRRPKTWYLIARIAIVERTSAAVHWDRILTRKSRANEYAISRVERKMRSYCFSRNSAAICQG
jgi:hypothetical protein